MFALLPCILVISLLWQSWSEVSWVSTGFDPCSPKDPDWGNISLWHFPAGWMIMTNSIMVLNQVVIWYLKLIGSYDSTSQHAIKWGPLCPKKPPEPHIGMIGKTRRAIKKFTTSLQAKRPVKGPIKNTLKLLALVTAYNIVRDVPNITLSCEAGLHSRFRHKRHKKGYLLTGKVDHQDIERLRNILGDLPQGVVTGSGDFVNIIDTGCSNGATGDEQDFVPGSLRPLSEPVMMDGIAGGLVISQKGNIRCQVITTKGTIRSMEYDAYLVPGLKCRLLSPQRFIKNNPLANCKYTVLKHRSELDFGDGDVVHIPYDKSTYLPVLQCHKDAMSSANVLALKGCVTDEANQNLTRPQKLLLKYHFKLGHLAFKMVQWIGRQGWLGPDGLTMGKHNLPVPKCAACQLGKQGRTPAKGRGTLTQGSQEAGALTQDKLSPGSLVFSDQYESRVAGRTFTSRGSGSAMNQYMGGTLFWDAATGYVSVHHQQGLGAHETIQAKLTFERECLQHGVQVTQYHTDNGIYSSKEFMKELAEKDQGHRICGVSAHHQNGAAENGIKIVVHKARTMMIHAALHWPGYSEKELWPMALSHAAYLYNHTPNSSCSFPPIELFTSSKSDHSALLNSHPWGCPVFVLAPKLRDGGKIPKWDPRSKRGQYMGHSPLHSTTVGLIWNLQTGTITPQFHLVFDDFFEIIFADDTEAPEE